MPVGDGAALAAAIWHAVTLDPGEREAIGLRAQTRAAKIFSLTAMQARTLGVYDGLLGSGLQKAFIESLRRP